MEFGADRVDQSGGAVGGFCRGGLDRLANSGDGVGNHDRLRVGTVMHLEMRPVEKQVVQIDADQVAVLEHFEIILEDLTDPRNRRFRQSHPETTSASNGAERTTPFPEELRRVRLDPVTQPRPFQTHRPRRRLDRKVAVAVALPLTLPVSSGVPLAAQPGRDFVLEDLLKHKPHRVAHQLLQTLLNRFSQTEHSIDIGADRLNRRYSFGHGVVSFDEFAALEGTNAKPRITPPMGRHRIESSHSRSSPCT